MVELPSLSLGYHRAVLSHVRRVDERAWEALRPAEVDDPGLNDTLLRNTYRLEAGGHPALHEAGRRAAEALGLEVEVEFFQAQGAGEPNASRGRFHPAITGGQEALDAEARRRSSSSRVRCSTG